MHEVPKASGGITNGPEHALIGEDDPEAIIPLSEKRRSRGLSLWKAAGAAMGVKMFADGGIVGGADQATPASGGAIAQIGSITIQITVHGGGDADSVVAALKEKMPEVANAVAEHIAKAMEIVFEHASFRGRVGAPHRAAGREAREIPASSAQRLPWPF